MQIIDSELFTILITDKGYKIVNKTNGKYYKKVYLGKDDSVENYGEVVDDKYINMDFVVELDELKKTVKESEDLNDVKLDLVINSIDGLYTMVESILEKLNKK